jgi:peptidoglycan hydrolase-like protein with peptidoglycan-binding domain
MAILKKGLSGEPVRRLQAKLGVEADGEFGPATDKALRDWQTKNGLAADGVAGPDTFMAMGLYELVLLKQGTRGATVKKLQEKLGVGADGQFGASTEKALRDYQTKNGLAADGLAGPATLAQMKLFKEITVDTVKSSQVPASAVPAGAPASVAADVGGGVRSIWDTIKGVFK